MVGRVVLNAPREMSSLVRILPVPRPLVRNQSVARPWVVRVPSVKCSWQDHDLSIGCPTQVRICPFPVRKGDRSQSMFGRLEDRGGLGGGGRRNDESCLDHDMCV